jgi:hypothetical protein
MDSALQKRIQEFRRRDRAQLRLIRESDGWHEQIRVKLKPLCRLKQFDNFCRCGQEQVYRRCVDCSERKTFTYHCDLKWCPRCNWRITKGRQNLITEWIKEIEQPKHLVTTQRNTTTFGHRMIRQHTKNLSRLRRSKVFEQVSGGCVSVEVTNEARGWHLHAHWLVNAHWVDAAELARTWGELVGQDYAIVKVLDLRDRKDFQREIAKYVCKGGEMSKWEPDELNEFVNGIRGHRFFFTFGDLFRLGPKIRARLNAEKCPTVCECGCSKFRWESETDRALAEIRSDQLQRSERKPSQQFTRNKERLQRAAEQHNLNLP